MLQLRQTPCSISNLNKRKRKKRRKTTLKMRTPDGSLRKPSVDRETNSWVMKKRLLNVRWRTSSKKWTNGQPSPQTKLWKNMQLAWRIAVLASQQTQMKINLLKKRTRKRLLHLLSLSRRRRRALKRRSRQMRTMSRLLRRGGGRKGYRGRKMRCVHRFRIWWISNRSKITRL